MTGRNNGFPFDEDGLPPDIEALLRAFPGRLTRLKEASGLSWSALARFLGVDRKQTRRWGNGGVEPAGGSILSLFHFASRIPGGLDILLGRSTEPELPDDEDEEGEDQDQEHQEHEQEDDEA